MCFTWLDMTTPPWCREKVMVYYYYYLRKMSSPWGLKFFFLDIINIWVWFTLRVSLLESVLHLLWIWFAMFLCRAYVVPLSFRRFNKYTEINLIRLGVTYPIFINIYYQEKIQPPIFPLKTSKSKSSSLKSNRLFNLKEVK